jgi:hypothetical protein
LFGQMAGQPFPLGRRLRERARSAQYRLAQGSLGSVAAASEAGALANG